MAVLIGADGQFTHLRSDPLNNPFNKGAARQRRKAFFDTAYAATAAAREENGAGTRQDEALVRR